MSVPDTPHVFFDTSVLFYLLSGDTRKADRVEQLLAKRGVISVQVLNEFAAVALRKLRLPLADVRSNPSPWQRMIGVWRCANVTSSRSMTRCWLHRH
jgi:predicted nucleic acid-binding protein